MTAFIKPLIQKGFIECINCGKIIKYEDAIRSVCPTCFEKNK